MPPPPTQGELGMALGAVDFENDFFEERAQQFLAIPIAGGRRRPNELQIRTENLNSLTFFLG